MQRGIFPRNLRFEKIELSRILLLLGSVLRAFMWVQGQKSPIRLAGGGHADKI